MNKDEIESVALTLLEMVDKWDEIKIETKNNWLKNQIKTLEKENSNEPKLIGDNKPLTIHSVVVSETELPDKDIKGFAKYVLGLTNRFAKHRMKPMTEVEGDKLINDLWLKYKFDTPVPKGN